jgi:FMN-dependent NADH-azoreductase
MPTLLRIDSSARHAASHSRRLGDAYETRWLRQHLRGEVRRRDLAQNPLPHISDETILGYYTPPDAMTDALRRATALSDVLVAELLAADALLITAPMYNFGLPSALKAWIDQIVRIGHTFSYDGQSFTGLVTGKSAFVALAYGAGGYGAGGALATFDLLKPYLQLLLGFLGFTDVTFAEVEATTGEAAVAEANLAKARDTITAMVHAA